MVTIEIQTKEKVLEKAKSIVSLAKTEIIATMDLNDEFIPDNEYFRLVERKVKEGVSLKRIAFGTSEQFDKFLIKDFKHKNYEVVLATTKNHERMLMIDRTQQLFKKEEKF
jgi:sugar-specific transcriptional regulator TrmB